MRIPIKSNSLSTWWKQTSSRYNNYQAGDIKIFYRPNTYDHFIIEELWKHDEYFLQQLQLPSEGIIIDIGAHIGAFALRADYLFPGRQILAFEPVIDNYKLLKKTILYNNCRNIIPIRTAVTGSGNTIKIYLSEQNTAGHSSIYQEYNRMITAPAMQLEQLLKKYNVNKVALLKIDCEGGEYDILYHIDPVQFKKIHYLAVEYHPVEHYNFETLQEWLLSKGLQMIAHKAGYFPGQGTALFLNTN